MNAMLRTMSQCPTVPKRVQLRHDTSTNWTSANPLLLAGEFAYETNTGRVKVGDGTTRWNSLPYLIDSGPTGPTGPIGGGGGGGGQVLYMETVGGSAPQSGTLRRQLDSTQTTIQTSQTIGTGFLMGTFLTNPPLSSTFIPFGLWDVAIHAAASQSGVTIYADLYYVDSDGVSNPVLIASGGGYADEVPVNVPSEVVTSINVPSTLLPDLTKRLRIRVFADFPVGSSSKTLTLYFGGNTVSHVHTTLTEPSPTGPTGSTGPTGMGSTGPTGMGPTGPTGPVGPAIVFDGGVLGMSFPYGPVLDCGGIFQSP